LASISNIFLDCPEALLLDMQPTFWYEAFEKETGNSAQAFGVPHKVIMLL